MQSPLPKTGMRDAARHARDELPVREPRVGLRRRPSVHRHRCRAGVLNPPGQVRRVELVRIPARAHLDRDRNLHRLRHRAHDARRVLGLAHQAAAGVVLGDLRHRAAHVDVDDVGAHALDDLRGGRHLLGIAAEDLDRDRPLFLGVLGVLERPIDAAHEPLGADHLGHDEPATAFALDEPAEGSVRHPRHRGEGERGARGRSLPIFMSVIGRGSTASVRLDIRGVDFDADGLTDQIDRQDQPRVRALAHQPAEHAFERAVARPRPSALHG